MFCSPACTEKHNVSLMAYELFSYLGEPLPIFALSPANLNLSTLFLVKINDIKNITQITSEKYNNITDKDKHESKILKTAGRHTKTLVKPDTKCKYSSKPRSTNIQQNFL